MVVRAATSHGKHLATIGVTEQRSRSIRSKKRANVPQHLSQLLPIIFFDSQIVCLAQNKGIEKELEYESMVSSRSFVVRAVWKDLLVHLAQQLAESPVTPFFCGSQFRQHQSQPEQTHDVGQVVIPCGDVGKLQIASNVCSML